MLVLVIFTRKNCSFLGTPWGYSSLLVLRSDNVAKTVSEVMGVVKEMPVVKGLIRGVYVVEFYS